jgi:acyl carrier protein
MKEPPEVSFDLKLHAVIADVLGISPDKVWAEAALVADLNATSLDFLEVVVEIEEAFGIDINDRDAAALFSVADFGSLIRRRQSEKREKQRPLSRRSPDGP